MLNLPNTLTLIRIVATPLIMILMVNPGTSRWAAVLFVVTALTDLVDGMIARRWGMITLLGKFLDPLADKILVLGTLLFLVQLDRVSPWIAFVIVGRELVVGTLRTVAIGEGVAIAARDLGKGKTAFQMAGITALILNETVSLGGWSIDLLLVGRFLLWVGALLALVSAVDYVLAFLRARPPRGASPAAASGEGAPADPPGNG